MIKNKDLGKIAQWVKHWPTVHHFRQDYLVIWFYKTYFLPSFSFINCMSKGKMDVLLPSKMRAALGLLQSGAGLLQGKPKRPAYEIPSAVKEMVQKTRKQSNLTERPGADAAKSAIKTNKANTVDVVQNMGGSSSNVMQGLMNAQSQENRALLDETANNESFRYQSFQDNIQSLRELGSYQDKAWEWNSADRYLEKRDRRDALVGAGINNIASGSEDLASNKLMEKYIDRFKPIQKAQMKPRTPFQFENSPVRLNPIFGFQNS